MELCQITKIYAIERNSILVFIFSDVLGQLEDVRRDIKEDTESIKEDVKNVSSDIKSVEKRMKEDVKYIKKDIIEGVGEGIKETLKEGVQSIEEHMKDIKQDIKKVAKAMKEMKNKRQPEMKEDYTRTPTENTDRDDSTNLRALHLRELHLVGFNFALNIKLSA